MKKNYTPFPQVIPHTQLLRIAGVDPVDDATYEAAGKLIENLIDEFVETATLE